MELNEPLPQDEMFSAAYEELRRRAHALTRGQGTPTLDATALVHEAYLKLAGNRRFRAESPQHLTYTVVRAMKYVLLDAARRRTTASRGGGGVPARRVPLDDATVQATAFDPATLLAMNLALRDLAQGHELEARAFELQFFGGLEIAEIARVMEVSDKKVQRLLRVARAFLARALTKDSRSPH